MGYRRHFSSGFQYHILYLVHPVIENSENTSYSGWVNKVIPFERGMISKCSEHVMYLFIELYSVWYLFLKVAYALTYSGRIIFSEYPFFI